MLGLLVAFVISHPSVPSPVPVQSRFNEKWIWGFTVDNLDDPDAITESFRRLPKKAMARAVFDSDGSPAYYKPALVKLKTAASIMGEPIDSVMTKELSLEQYRARMVEYMDGLKGVVDMWEIGNEVNGDWGGPSLDVAAKVNATIKETKKRRLTSALTLFYSDHYIGTDRDMDTWSRKYLSSEVRRDVNYLFISFYPQSATGTHPDWTRIFSDLGRTFPNAKLGFGELGLALPDFTLSKDVAANERLARRYYRMAPPIPSRFVGGFFWWSFRQDAVPYHKRMWTTFNDLMRK